MSSVDNKKQGNDSVYLVFMSYVNQLYVSVGCKRN